MSMKYSGRQLMPHLQAAFREFQTSPGDFIGREVFPILRMPNDAGVFARITRETLLQHNTTLERAPGAAYPEFDIAGEDDSYQTKGYGLKTKLPEEKIAQYGTFFDAEMVALASMMRQFDMHHELRVAAKMQNTTTFTGDDLYLDVSGSQAWDDPTKDIIGTVEAGKYKIWKNTGMEPNALIVNKQQLGWILMNEDIIAKFPGAVTITRSMIEAALTGIFGVERLIVSKGIYNGANQGQSFSGSLAWSSMFASLAIVGNAGEQLDVPCVGRTLQWDADEAGDGGVVQYFDEDRDTWHWKTKMFTDEKLFEPYFAFLMKVDAG